MTEPWPGPWLSCDLAMTEQWSYWRCCDWAVTWPWLSCDLAVTELWPGRDWAVTWPWLSCDLAVTELWPRRDWAVTSPWLSCDLAMTSPCRDHWAPEPRPPIDVTKMNVLHSTMPKRLICSWYPTIYIKICTYICRIKTRVCEQILMVFRNQYISNTHRKIQWVKQLNVNATIPTRKTEWPTITERHVFIYSNLLSTISWIWGEHFNSLPLRDATVILNY